MASPSGAGGTGSDCEGEEQEDPSSSSRPQEVAEVTEALQKLNVQESLPNNNDVDELSAFRQQWQRELEATPTRQKPAKPKEEAPEPVTDEEKAKQLFLCGVELERGGKLYEAIQHYKRAMQILPDVETRLYESSEIRPDTPEEESEPEYEPREENLHPSDDEDAVEGEDLLERLQRILAKRGVLCEPQVPTDGAHISWLPYEVLLVVARWVVSAELDAAALERMAGVCRGLYVLAREPDIWRSLCVRTWGIDCGTPRAGGFASWRQMFVERPRLRLNGCYISKTTYLRHGENSFQDQFYRPWYLIDYYRYLRFFPEGMVLMWTTAEEPGASVAHLRHRQVKPGLGIMSGHYRLIGDKVVIVIKKSNSEKKSSQPSTTRFRARRKEPDQPDQTFHLELELRSSRCRRNWSLQWERYAVSSRRDHWTTFDLSPAKFPPFAFSRVRSYTAETSAPLLPTHAYT
ncbi:hypothetical protein O3G_MSEX001941 [Manduca sexta]|uniref:F-box protein Hrt3/FBXO9 C-terminal domain-containing protein n=1 Tax=Manduca sexta TaxID=7130 RepID=A0A921YLS0_MANSE|nr:hypothetical protein O3G_MSEX001941 [Manduca sexta]